MAPTMTRSRRDMVADRAELLKSVGMTMAQFREVMDSRSLTAAEWAVREQLEEIEFLLGEQPVDD